MDGNKTWFKWRNAKFKNKKCLKHIVLKNTSKCIYGACFKEKFNVYHLTRMLNLGANKHSEEKIDTKK